MARRRRQESASFDDMPESLQNAVGPDVPDELKRELATWVESHGLTMVDFFSWKRAYLDRRPPSRRRKLGIVNPVKFW